MGAGCSIRKLPGELTRRRAGFIRSWAGFSWFALLREILVEMFFDLGGNLDRKSSNTREIRGIGARNFVAM
jgi:hypothetical protein